MSKIIKITPDCLDSIRDEFEKVLSSAKISDGKISYTKTFGYIDRKAVVRFSEIAWLKMSALIREFDKEVAWHGVAVRGADETKDEYYIVDILVYPQEVTGSNVNTDQTKYEMWLMEHDDEVFNNIRMQGHSHVNMHTSPSTVDISHQERILEQLEDDMFYIFMIWNKRGEKNIKVYDLEKNILFDGADVVVEVDDGELGLNSFIKDAKSLVTEKTYTAPAATYGSSYANKGSSVPATHVAATPATTPVVANVGSGGKNGKKKGKRADVGSAPSSRYPTSLPGQVGMNDYDGYDDDDYGPYGFRRGYNW